MSAIVSLQNPGSSSSEFIVTVKGAPETLRSMVSFQVLYLAAFYILFPSGGCENIRNFSVY